jgi:DNA-binding MurR/RpiR family transcriptional regulator
LTESGLATFERLASGHETEVSRLFAHLSEVEVDRMTDLLKRAARVGA